MALKASVSSRGYDYLPIGDVGIQDMACDFESLKCMGQSQMSWASQGRRSESPRALVLVVNTVQHALEIPEWTIRRSCQHLSFSNIEMHPTTGTYEANHPGRVNRQTEPEGKDHGSDIALYEHANTHLRRREWTTHLRLAAAASQAPQNPVWGRSLAGPQAPPRPPLRLHPLPGPGPGRSFVHRRASITNTNLEELDMPKSLKPGHELDGFCHMRVVVTPPVYLALRGRDGPKPDQRRCRPGQASWLTSRRRPPCRACLDDMTATGMWPRSI